MGTTKHDFFSVEQNEMSLIFKALGHPARLAILEFLIQIKSCYTGDIVSELPLAQATVSQHLKELKNAGIIQGNIEGKNVCYCLNPEALNKIETLIKNFNQNINAQNEPCC